MQWKPRTYPECAYAKSLKSYGEHRATASGGSAVVLVASRFFSTHGQPVGIQCFLSPRQVANII